MHFYIFLGPLVVCTHQNFVFAAVCVGGGGQIGCITVLFFPPLYQVSTEKTMTHSPNSLSLCVCVCSFRFLPSNILFFFVWLDCWSGSGVCPFFNSAFPCHPVITTSSAFSLLRESFKHLLCRSLFLWRKSLGCLSRRRCGGGGGGFGAHLGLNLLGKVVLDTLGVSDGYNPVWGVSILGLHNLDDTEE